MISMPSVPKTPKPAEKNKTAPPLTRQMAPKKKSEQVGQHGSKQTRAVKSKEAPKKARPVPRGRNAKAANEPISSDLNVGKTHGATPSDDPPPTSATVSTDPVIAYMQTQPPAPDISTGSLDLDTAMQVVMEENRRLKS